MVMMMMMDMLLSLLLLLLLLLSFLSFKLSEKTVSHHSCDALWPEIENNVTCQTSLLHYAKCNSSASLLCLSSVARSMPLVHMENETFR